MPRTKEQYEAMRTASRNKIHLAAIELFAKKGLAGTNVQDIADNAGVSIGLMYRYYKTKDDLFNDLVSYAAAGLERMIEVFKDDSTPADRIQQFATEILNDLKKDDQFVRFFMIMNQASTMEEPSSQVQYLNKQSEAMLNQAATLIKKGQELGQFKQGNASEMALYFFASIQGLIMIKHTMKERSITPSPQIVTAFLMNQKA